MSGLGDRAEGVTPREAMQAEYDRVNKLPSFQYGFRTYSIDPERMQLWRWSDDMGPDHPVLCQNEVVMRSEVCQEVIQNWLRGKTDIQAFSEREGWIDPTQDAGWPEPKITYRCERKWEETAKRSNRRLSVIEDLAAGRLDLHEFGQEGGWLLLPKGMDRDAVNILHGLERVVNMQALAILEDECGGEGKLLDALLKGRIEGVPARLTPELVTPDVIGRVQAWLEEMAEHGKVAA